MQTIKITITSEKAAAVVLTEKKPTTKRAPGKKLKELFDLIPKPAVINQDTSFS